MKLYTNPNRTLAQQPFYGDGLLPASAYRLQQQTLAAYREMCTWYDPYDLLELVYLPGSGGRALCDESTGRPLRGAMSKLEFETWARKQVRQAREKLRELIPEIVLLLTVPELEQAAGILFQRGLVPFIWHIFAIERGVQYRIDEGNSDTRLCDDSHAKAAGLGRTYTHKRNKAHLIQEEDVELPTVELVEPTALPPTALEQSVTAITQVTPVAVETPVTAVAPHWPHTKCAVCPGPKLRNTVSKAKARKRLQFNYRR